MNFKTKIPEMEMKETKHNARANCELLAGNMKKLLGIWSWNQNNQDMFMKTLQQYQRDKAESRQYFGDEVRPFGKLASILDEFFIVDQLKLCNPDLMNDFTAFRRYSEIIKKDQLQKILEIEITKDDLLPVRVFYATPFACLTELRTSLMKSYKEYVTFPKLSFQFCFFVSLIAIVVLYLFFSFSFHLILFGFVKDCLSTLMKNKHEHQAVRIVFACLFLLDDVFETVDYKKIRDQNIEALVEKYYTQRVPLYGELTCNLETFITDYLTNFMKLQQVE